MTVRVLTHWTPAGALHQGDLADCPLCHPTEETPVPAAAAPWPIVGECHSRHLPDHSCPQCDGSHDHQWAAWHDADPKALGLTGPGVPVRCRTCGGRKCDRPACLLTRHHYGPHEEF